MVYMEEIKKSNSREQVIEKLRIWLLVFLSIEVIGVTFSMALSSIAFVITVLLWVTKLILERKWIRTPMDICFLLYIIAEIVSTIFSIDPWRSFIFMKRLFIFTIFFMCFHSIKKERELKIFLIVLFSLTGILSVLEIVLKYILNIDRIGVFQHYMTTGGIKMIACLYIIPFLVDKGLGRKIKFYLLLIIIPSFIALVLTMTRSSWLGFLGGIIVYGIIKNRQILIYLFVFIVLFMLFAPIDIKQRANSAFDPQHFDNRTRINMITTGWRIFQDYPFFGIGDIGTREIYMQYTTPLEPNEGVHFHNNIIHVMVTLGSFGIIAYLLLFITLFVYIWKTFKMVKDDVILSSLSMIPILVFFAFHINGLFEWNFGAQAIAILLWFTMGLSVVTRNIYYAKKIDGYSKA